MIALPVIALAGAGALGYGAYRVASGKKIIPDFGVTETADSLSNSMSSMISSVIDIIMTIGIIAMIVFAIIIVWRTGLIEKLAKRIG